MKLNELLGLAVLGGVAYWVLKPDPAPALPTFSTTAAVPELVAGQKAESPIYGGAKLVVPPTMPGSAGIVCIKFPCP